MQIHQLSISYDQVEDRLLVRLNTQDAQEYRFWFTRRMTLRLVPAMNQFLVRLEAAQPGVAAPDHNAQKILADIQRDAFLQNADFATPYAAKAHLLPLGDEPMLVTDVQLKLQANGSLEVIFQKKIDEFIQSCHLNLHAPLVHGFIHLVNETLVKAEWEMSALKLATDHAPEHTLAVDPVAYNH